MPRGPVQEGSALLLEDEAHSGCRLLGSQYQGPGVQAGLRAQ